MDVVKERGRVSEGNRRGGGALYLLHDTFWYYYNRDLI